MLHARPVKTGLGLVIIAHRETVLLRRSGRQEGRAVAEQHHCVRIGVRAGKDEGFLGHKHPIGHNSEGDGVADLCMVIKVLDNKGQAPGSDIVCARSSTQRQSAGHHPFRQPLRNRHAQEFILPRGMDGEGELLTRNRGCGTGVNKRPGIKVIFAGFEHRQPGMRAAIDPVIVVPVLPGEPVVVLKQGVCGERVTPPDRTIPPRIGWFCVVIDCVVAGALHRLCQQWQRHGRLQHLPRRDNVIKHPPGFRLLPQHLEGGHGRTPILGSILHQHERCGGVVRPLRDIQVVPGGEGRSAAHDGMLFVRVVARQCQIVLPVDRPKGLQRIQCSTPQLAREHDFAWGRRPLNGVTPDHRGPVNRGKTQPVAARIRPCRARVCPEPPDLQQVRARDRIHRNDRPLGGCGEPANKWVYVGLGIVQIAHPDVQVPGKIIPGTLLIRRSLNPVPDIDRLVHNARSRVFSRPQGAHRLHLGNGADRSSRHCARHRNHGGGTPGIGHHGGWASGIDDHSRVSPGICNHRGGGARIGGEGRRGPGVRHHGRRTSRVWRRHWVKQRTKVRANQSHTPGRKRLTRLNICR